jgi:acyl carrier protein
MPPLFFVKAFAMDDERARGVIADHFGVPASAVTETADFLALGADSLDMVSLTMRLEEEFNIHIEDDHVEDCRTVADALSLVRRSLKVRQAA